MRLFAIGIILITLGCGKVGDPLPPFIRIPEAVKDLSVEQRAYQLHFEWTNPDRNVDQSRLNEPVEALLSLDGEIIDRTIVNQPGQRQHLKLDARKLIGSTLEFTIHLETERKRASGFSNPAPITVVTVPGPTVALKAIVDQGVVTLNWRHPLIRSELVEAYRIYRSGRVLSDLTAGDLMFEDETFEVGGSYVYTVMAMRRVGVKWTEGLPSDSFSITATDRTAPNPPRALVLTPTVAGAFLNWEANSESDVASYRVFRKSTLSGDFLVLGDPQLTNVFFDPEFRSGFQYVVTALDEAGNESYQSKPTSD